MPSYCYQNDNKTITQCCRIGAVKIIKASIFTLGCKVNQYESAAIAESLRNNGYTVAEPSEICDVYIINSCTVTALSDKKSRQAVHRFRRANPQAVIVLCGCMAQNTPAEGADIVVTNAQKHRIHRIISDYIEEKDNDTPPESGCLFDENPAYMTERARAYIKIQDGCDRVCTYCIIPSVRGRTIRSREYGGIADEIEALRGRGICEFVLTGIEVSSYGAEKSRQFGLIELMERLDSELGGGVIIRLGSMDPAALTPDFIARYARLKTAAPHIHLSLQSGSDAVLARMKRRYNSDMVRGRIAMLREMLPGIVFTADIITGFPGETDADFADTVELIRHICPYHTHIFAYSKREGTPAAEMPGQIPPAVKRGRSAALESVSAECKSAVLAGCVGKSMRAVVERDTGTYCDAKGENYTDIRITGKGRNGLKRGGIIDITADSCDNKYIYYKLR